MGQPPRLAALSAENRRRAFETSPLGLGLHAQGPDATAPAITVLIAVRRETRLCGTDTGRVFTQLWTKRNVS